MRSLFLKRGRTSPVLSSPELKNPERELYYFRRRLTIAAAGIVLVFAGLLGRFVDLQVIQHRHYQTLAESNRIAIVPIVPNRGVITDRNGVVLAQSYSAYTLEVTPSRVRNLDETIDGLAGLVDIQPRDRKRFKRLLDESKNLESVPLRNRLSDEEVARFAVNRYRFPGVEIKARLFRQYPFGEMASHVIGYIGRINDRDLVDRIGLWGETANYKGTDYIGKIGLELSYERELHGTTGVEEVEVDAAGRAVRTLSRTLPTSGNNLKLSLDIRLQQAAETAFGAHRGAMVALDPSTGEVLAFVSKPGFDPNLFVDGIDPASWDALNDSPDKPLLNRPLRGAYPPGSTIKPFLALSALTSGKRTAGQTIFDPGFYQIAGSTHRFRDDKPEGHGYVDMTKSIIVSCDTYYYMLAGDTDIDVTARFPGAVRVRQQNRYRLRRQRGSSGVLPSRAWKRDRFSGKNYRDEQRKWYLGDSISAGIGQGYNAFTPMQQAEAIATIANDGVGFQPHLVKTIEDIKTGAVREIAPVVSHIVAVKPEDLALIKNALVGVAREGTSAPRLRRRAVRVCGQDRHGAAVFAQGREIPAGPPRRAPA